MARRERVASTRRAFARLGSATHARSAPTAVTAPAGVPPGPPPLSPPLGSLFDTAPEAWVALCTAADPERLDHLARLALGFSPRVSLESDAVLLEVRGSFQLFGGPHLFLQAFQQPLRGPTLGQRHTVAQNPH